MAQNLKSEMKVILRHSSVFGLSNVLGQVISILLLPLYTRYLTPTDYGALEVLYFVSTIASIVIGMGMTEAMSRFYFDSDKPEDRNRVVSTTILGIGTLYLGICSLLIFASPYAARFLLDSAEYTIHFRVLFLTLGIQFSVAIAAAYLRVIQRSFTLLFMSLAQMVLSIAANIWFIVGLEWGSLGMLTATLLVQTLIGGVAIGLILRKVGFGFNVAIYKDMVKFGLPMIPSNLGSYMMIASDRYFVKEYVSLSSTGLYSLGYKIGAMVHSFLTAPFIQIWFPRRYEHFGKDNSEEIFARIFSYFTAVLTFAALAVSLLARDIVKIMTTEPFWSSYKVVPIVALAHVIHALYYHFTIAITMKKQTKYYAYLNVTVGVLNLGLNLLLIRAYGIWGAALSTLFTYIARSGLVYFYANRLVPITWEAGRFFKVLGSALAVFAVGSLLASDSLFVDIGIQLAILLLYPILLFITGFISPREIATAREYIKMYRQRLIPNRAQPPVEDTSGEVQKKEG